VISDTGSSLGGAGVSIRPLRGLLNPRRVGLAVLTRIVVDVGEASGVELELSNSSARTHGGFSCPTVMPG
jgi:hypothetical protein